MIFKRMWLLILIFLLPLFFSCGVKLDVEKNLTDLAAVSLKTEGDSIYCSIEPREKIPDTHFVVFRCFRGDKLLWKSGYQVKQLAEKFKGQKVWKCRVVGGGSSIKAKDVKRVRASLSPYLPYN